MIGSLTFTRDDGETFTFSAVNPPYQLTPETQLPAGLALDVSGGEYTGRNGGYTLAGRLQRRTAKIVYNVRETYSDSRSMMQLLNDAAEFFRPMTADLRVVSFDMLVQTDDGNKSAYIMRRGHVTTPFMAPLLRGGHGSYAAEFDLIFDDPLLYWADGSGVVSGDILPAALPGSKIGETWREGLQVWAAGLSRWEYPDHGGGGTPQTVHVVSAYQVPVAFKVTGQITNPKIVNSRNGSQWSWEGTIPYGCVVTVDVDGVALDWHGNRLLNTMGGLVAAPGDNTFTLTGSDLVLDVKAAWTSTPNASWTGTPNASASTLSQDGKVVATNLILSPLPRAADYAVKDGSLIGSPTVSDQTDGMKITSNGSGNPGASKGGYTLPAGSYHLHAELSEVSGTKWTDMMLGFWGYITPYPSVLSHGIVDYDVTLTSDMPSTEFVLKCPTDGYAVWRHIGLYTDSDWQAMKALGVDWFDGDSDFNQGQGDVVNKRASTLSQDGKVVATNVNTDPNSTWQRYHDSDNVTAVKNSDNTWTYTVGASSTPSWFVPMPWWGFKAAGNIQFIRWRETDIMPNWTEAKVLANGPGWMVVTNKNNINSAGIYITPGKSMTLLQTGEYTASDWAAMQALGVKWFDGDSTFNIVTAKASVEIRGAF